MRVLVTLCARGGSKGVPGKNVAMIQGKPLIVHSIEHAKKWRGAARVVCSTDCEEIAAIARKAGADTPFIRPSSLATDHAGKVGVIRHALIECEKTDSPYDAVMDLDVSAPLRTTDDLDRSLSLFEMERPEILLSAVKARKNPYFNMVERLPSGKVSIVKRLQGPILSRQDAPVVYELNGSIYIFDAPALRNGSYISVTDARFEIYEMSDESRYDIDSETDLLIVQALINRLL